MVRREARRETEAAGTDSEPPQRRDAFITVSSDREVATPVTQPPDNSPVQPTPPRFPAAGEEPHAGPPAAAATWVDVELATVEENLALDEALLELAHEGLAATACVRTWMAAEPTVVLGSSGRRDEEVDLEACRRHGVRVIRRPSGGGTVLLGPGCLMWSVVAPCPQGPPPIEAIHAGMLEPLAAAVTAELCTRAAAGDRLDGGAMVVRCGTSDLALVRTDAAGECLVGGGRAAVADRPSPSRDIREHAKKVSGNALRVRRHGVLYHGTLLDAFDLGLISRVLRHPPREPDYRGGRNHGEFLATLGLGRQTLERLVRAAFGAEQVTADWPRDRVARLVRDRYAAAEWTERL